MTTKITSVIFVAAFLGALSRANAQNVGAADARHLFSSAFPNLQPENDHSRKDDRSYSFKRKQRWSFYQRWLRIKQAAENLSYDIKDESQCQATLQIFLRITKDINAQSDLYRAQCLEKLSSRTECVQAAQILTSLEQGLSDFAKSSDTCLISHSWERAYFNEIIQDEKKLDVTLSFSAGLDSKSGSSDFLSGTQANLQYAVPVQDLGGDFSLDAMSEVAFDAGIPLFQEKIYPKFRGSSNDVDWEIGTYLNLEQGRWTLLRDQKQSLLSTGASLSVNPSWLSYNMNFGYQFGFQDSTNDVYTGFLHHFRYEGPIYILKEQVGLKYYGLADFFVPATSALYPKWQGVGIGVRFEALLLGGGQGELVFGFTERRDESGFARLFPKFEGTLKTKRLPGFSWMSQTTHLSPESYQASVTLGIDTASSRWSAQTTTKFIETKVLWVWSQFEVPVKLFFKAEDHISSTPNGPRILNRFGVDAEPTYKISPHWKVLLQAKWENLHVISTSTASSILWNHPQDSRREFYGGFGVTYEF